MAGNRQARERFDFSLDARQVAGVTLGALGTLAVAFLLGLWLGQRSPDRVAPAAARSAPAQAAAAVADPLAALDKAPRPDGGEPKEDLTFHETLTSAKPPADKLPPAPKATPIPAPAPASPPAPVAASTAPQPASGPSGASGPGAAPRAPSASEAQPAAAASAAAPPPAKPAASSAKPATPPAKGTTAKGAPPKPAPSKAAGPSAAKTAPAKGAFSVQVGSTQDRAEADKIAARFTSRGARVTVADVPGKGRWYRVRLGAFETREAADRYLKDLERSTGARGFVAAAN